MKRNVPSVPAMLMLCSISSTALADWTAKGELGASFATGNSETESANAALEVKYTLEKWTHTMCFAGNYGRDSSTTTAQRWEVRGQSDYKFTERAYWFGAGRYEDDRFSAYAFRATAATGLGYKFNDTERTKFWIQGGPGYRYAEFNETGKRLASETSFGRALSFQYDPAGNRTRITWPDGNYVQYDYDVPAV